MNADEPGPTEPLTEDLAEADLADPVECAAAVLRDDSQSRLWLRAVLPILQARTNEPDPVNRVQYAYDRMYIAACERVSRILRSDLPAI